METWFYEVVSIDGDYANLRRTDIESNDLKLVARALLPLLIKNDNNINFCRGEQRSPVYRKIAHRSQDINLPHKNCT